MLSRTLRRVAAPCVATAISLAFVTTAAAAPTHYVQMSDGAQIAINVKVPTHCLANPCPTFLEMSGYESGSDEGRTVAGHLADDTGLPLPLQTGTRAAHAARAGIDERYVTVLASVRGTGCSSGEFDVFSWRSALDGKELIDGWIVHQPWSDDRVAIFGHSYSGLTGMMIASTRPAHLVAVSASGLFGDVYRDIVYPGGVTNYGFPLLWTGAVRPAYDYLGGTLGGLYPVENTTAQCAANQAGRSRTLTGEPLINGLDDTDSGWYASRSLNTTVGQIEVPVHVTAASQDEQTGGRGPTHVFDHLSDAIPRRLVLTNGNHGTQTEDHIWKDRVAWLDYWMLGDNEADLGVKTGVVSDLSAVFGTAAAPRETTRLIIGYLGGGNAVAEVKGDGFPIVGSRWLDLYVSGGGKLSTVPATTAGASQWINGSRRQSYSYQAGKNEGAQFSSPAGPDEVELSTAPEAAPLVIAGPVTANLFVSSTAPDTELFVQLIDRAPDGSMLYLSRGLLRGSHRQVDVSKSQSFDGRVYRPWRPHEDRALVLPGAVTEYVVDVFPFGHVLQPGHRLVAKLHAPPADDNDYNYVLRTLPSVNTLHFGPATPSRLLFVTYSAGSAGPITPPATPCAYWQMRCVKGAAPSSTSASAGLAAPVAAALGTRKR